MFWSHNERKRVDGPSRNSFGRGNPRQSRNIDDDIRQIIADRANEAFDGRPDDVSGANEVQHYAMLQESTGKCCRGEDRLTVSNINLGYSDDCNRLTFPISIMLFSNHLN